MTDLEHLWDIDNLRRAWRWVLADSDAKYKAYCRDQYAIFAVVEDELLGDLSERLKTGKYEPNHADKMLLPKAAPAFRPYSILTVEDLIVYQAAINIVAEKFHPKIQYRYLKTTFGHLYAGKSSQWFYRKWQNCYKAYNQAARDAFTSGFVYSATFDLTACYDSIDHGVLNNRLLNIGVDEPFVKYLVETLLSKWTATMSSDHSAIYLRHGIPQGPSASGLLSETVLSEFDNLFDPRNKKRAKKANGIKYFRYVDDIRLFAKSKIDVEWALLELDRCSKRIGLFPQGSKIDIKEIKSLENLNNQLKSISIPPEPVLSNRPVIQERLRDRLNELLLQLSQNQSEKLATGQILTPKVSQTRIKYLLAQAEPDQRIALRILEVLGKDIRSYYLNISWHLARYEKLDDEVVGELIDIIQSSNLYSAIVAEFVSLLAQYLPNHISSSLIKKIDKIVKQDLVDGSSGDLLAATFKWAIKRRAAILTQRKPLNLIKQTKSWWAKAQIVGMLDATADPQMLIEALDVSVANTNTDIALSGAWKAIQLGQGKYLKSSSHTCVNLILNSCDTNNGCPIQRGMYKITKWKSNFDWKLFFGDSYEITARHMFICQGAYRADIRTWVSEVQWLANAIADVLSGTDEETAGKSNFPSLKELITYLNGQSIPGFGHRNPSNRFRNIKFNDRAHVSNMLWKVLLELESVFDTQKLLTGVKS